MTNVYPNTDKQYGYLNGNGLKVHLICFILLVLIVGTFYRGDNLIA